MNPDVVFAKTEKGKEQLTARRDIPIALRYALILVDGRSTLKELLKKGAGLPDFSDSLEMLEHMGLIAPTSAVAAAAATVTTAATVAAPGYSSPQSATRSTAGGASVKQLLVALATSMLADRAGKVIRKVEESDDSDAALMRTIESCGKVINLVIDEKKSAAFVLAANDILDRQR